MNPPATMTCLLTWPAYGTWFPTPRRGWIDRGGAATARPSEPTRHATGSRPLKWPPVRLDAGQRRLVIDELARIAALRDFEVHLAAAAADHVHVLLSCRADRDIPRLVQLVKGALSRALTVAAGDRPARSTRGRSLVHHKWWARQYSCLPVRDPGTSAALTTQLEAHAAAGAAVRRAAGHRPDAAGL